MLVLQSRHLNFATSADYISPPLYGHLELTWTLSGPKFDNKDSRLKLNERLNLLVVSCCIIEKNSKKILSKDIDTLMNLEKFPVLAI